MANQILSDLEFKLKKLAKLSKKYTDEKAASGEVYLWTSGTPAENYLKTYVLSSGASGSTGTLIGTIDIPKDYLVKEAHTLVVVASGTPSALTIETVDGSTTIPASYSTIPSTITSVGTWLDFIINVATGSTDPSHVSVKMDDFIDVYTGGSGITVNGKTVNVRLSSVSGLEFSGDTQQLQIKVDDANGLGLDEHSGLTLDLATWNQATSAGTNGAMGAEDKEQLFKSTTDLMNDKELCSWFGYTYATDADDPISGTSQESITPES